MKLLVTPEWIKKMTESKWHKTKEDYAPILTFTVDHGQAMHLTEWGEEHDKTCPFSGLDENGLPKTGAIGGALTFSLSILV